MKKYLIIISASTFLAFVMIFGMLSCNRHGTGEKPGEMHQAGSGRKFVCSMHPQVIRDNPGDCPICKMFLIELIEKDRNSFDSSLIGVTAPVNKLVVGSVRVIRPEKISCSVPVEAQGIINYDPRKVVTVSARFGGLIEKSFVKYQFQYIKKGQKIYEIYNPYIYNDRWYYVRLIQTYPDRDDLTAEALEWFRLLGLSEGQIDSLKKAAKPDYYLPVYSSAEGYAVSSSFDPETFFSEDFGAVNDSRSFIPGNGNIGLNEGIRISAGDPLFKLIDITSLRADLKVKTESGTLLKHGQKVIITDQSNPEIKFEAAIDQVDPLNGGLFQTVRVYLTDKKRILMPGRKMQALITADDRERIWVPASSVINLGHQQTVFVYEGGRFHAREVTTGARLANRIEILSGIEENAEIAEKALLLIDSDGIISLNQ